MLERASFGKRLGRVKPALLLWAAAGATSCSTGTHSPDDDVAGSAGAGQAGTATMSGGTAAGGGAGNGGVSAGSGTVAGGSPTAGMGGESAGSASGGNAGSAGQASSSGGMNQAGGPAVATCTPGSAVPTLKQTTVAQTGSAMHMTGVPGEDTLYILERGGKLRVVKAGKLQEAALVTVAPGEGTERGALSVALHPKFAENGQLYIAYAADNGDTTVDAFKRMGDTAAFLKNVYRYAHSAAIHQGGMAEFGPDGYLYLSVGDNGENGKPSQMADSRLGKILRIDAETGMPAPGNLSSYTWHLGLRNPWRWSFDRATGAMYIGHVGQNTYESIDYAPPAAKGLNFGWPMDEGVCSGGGLGGPGPACGKGVTSAILQYGGGQKAVIGGYVYRGTKIPGLCGRYFYADHLMGFVRSFVVVDGKVTDQREHPELANGGQIVSFGEDGAGELYVVRINGLVTRIDAK